MAGCNTTSQQLFDYGNLTTPARTYTNVFIANPGSTYMIYPASNYTSRYIYNRLLSTTLTAGSNTWQLVSNGYDSDSTGGSTLTDVPGIREHDANYSTAFYYRGNLTGSTTLSGSTGWFHDIGGNGVRQTVNGLTVSSTPAANTNWVAPATITAGNLTTSLNWNGALNLTSETGPNGDTASVGYDIYQRPGNSQSPWGASTTNTYNDTATPPTRISQTVSTGGTRWTRVTLDGLGRTYKTETGTGATTTTPVSVVDAVYGPCGCSPIGKLMKQSMPHANGAQTVNWKVFSYDAIGRTVSVVEADGASTTTYSYSGNTVTVKDPAGKWKTFTMDAFGNLTTVVEPDPNRQPSGSYLTNYTYDGLNHLTLVSMQRPSGNGTYTQTRTFNYTGALLMSKTEPETGTTTYAYNSDMTLQSKTDAKNQQTIYTYDSLKRVTLVQHFPVAGGAEDTCQQVNYTYDSDLTGYSQYVSGRLASVSYKGAGCVNSAGGSTFTEQYSYAIPGGVVGKQVTVARSVVVNLQNKLVSQALGATFGYDNEGRLAQVNYPLNGPSYSFAYDALGRAASMTDNVANSQVANGFSYGPANELLGFSYFGTSETRSYNARLQLTQLNSVTFSYSATQNNGKIQSQTDAVSGEQIVYSYDQLNRLLEAHTADNVNVTQWGQQFTYDGFGNLTGKSVSKGTAPTMSAPADPATNRIVGNQYDANGNDTALGTYSYDVENRFVGSGSLGYSYSPSNQRVWKGVSSGSTVTEEMYFWGPNGKQLGTYSINVTVSNFTPSLNFVQTGVRVWLGGKLLASTDPSTGTLVVRSPDRLGSNGKYFPYGEDRGTANPATGNVKFATYTRDGETGLDYAVARYYVAGTGRFNLSDPLGGQSPTEPASWNGYAYVGGDPIGFSDPWGLNRNSCVYDLDCVPSCDDQASAFSPTPSDPFCLAPLIMPVGRRPDFSCRIEVEIRLIEIASNPHALVVFRVLNENSFGYTGANRDLKNEDLWIASAIANRAIKQIYLKYGDANNVDDQAKYAGGTNKDSFNFGSVQRLLNDITGISDQSKKCNDVIQDIDWAIEAVNQVIGSGSDPSDFMPVDTHVVSWLGFQGSLQSFHGPFVCVVNATSFYALPGDADATKCKKNP